VLASMFGDTPKIPLVAGRVHRVAGGNPRDILQLTRNLVDSRIIRWEAGGWALPSALHADAVPASPTDAMRLRVQSLGRHALELARFLAASHLPALSLDDFSALCQQGTADLLSGLGELVAANLVRVEAGAYRFSHPVWREIFAESLDRDTRLHLHGRLALFFARGSADPLPEIQHLRWSGQDSAALERLVAFCDTSQRETREDPARFLELVSSLPSDWYELLDWGIECVRAQGGPAAAICALQGRMAGILPTTTPHLGARHVSELIARLASDAGLDLYEGLAPDGDPRSRLQTALGQAQHRFEIAAEHERVLPPSLAIRQLAEIMLPAAAIAATTYDHELWLAGPSLAPLHPLSSALHVVSLVWQGLGARMSGRLESALDSYARAVALLGQPDRAGLAPAHATYGRLGIIWGMGMIQAMLGLRECLTQADVLNEDPWYRVSGIQLRMLHAYWQGEPARADAEKERWMVCLVECKSGSWFEGGHLVAELTAHAMAGDLDRLRAIIPDISKLAELCPGWRPVYQYALGEYHRLRGDLPKALAAHESARTAGPPCEHQIWAYAASAELQVLIALEQYAAAIAAGERYWEAALQGGLVQLAQHICIPLARACAGAGQFGRALALLRDVLTTFERLGVTGLILGWTHETRVQVAVHAGDDAQARRALEDCLVHFRADENGLGRRRCERLKEAIDACATAVQQREGTPGLGSARARAALEAHCIAPNRAGALLQLLLEETGACGGILHLCGEGALETATLGLGPERAQMGKLLEDIVSNLSGAEPDFETTTATALDCPSALTERVRPLILQHGPADGRIVTGVALMVVARDMPFVESSELASAISQVLSRAAGRC